MEKQACAVTSDPVGAYDTLVAVRRTLAFVEEYPKLPRGDWLVTLQRSLTEVLRYAESECGAQFDAAALAGDYDWFVDGLIESNDGEDVRADVADILARYRAELVRSTASA